MKKVTTEQLEELIELEVAHYKRILSGENPTIQELTAARKFLKDNGIEVTPEHDGVMKMLPNLNYVENPLAEAE